MPLTPEHSDELSQICDLVEPLRHRSISNCTISHIGYDMWDTFLSTLTILVQISETSSDTTEAQRSALRRLRYQAMQLSIHYASAPSHQADQD